MKKRRDHPFRALSSLLKTKTHPRYPLGDNQCSQQQRGRKTRDNQNQQLLEECS
jgi:hypothetical protein